MEIHLLVLIFSIFAFHSVSGTGNVDFTWGVPFDNTSCCSLNSTIIAEIAAYKPIADQIHKLVKNGSFKSKFYKDLSTFVDTYGSRLSGSEMFEKSVTYMYKELKKVELDNLHTENVIVPDWVRYVETSVVILNV